MVTLREAAFPPGPIEARILLPSTTIGIQALRPLLVLRLTPLRIPLGRCRARFVMFQDPVVTPTQQVPSRKLVLISGPLRLPITVNAVIAPTVKVVQMGSKASPTVRDPVLAPWVSLVRFCWISFFFFACMAMIKPPTSVSAYCISQLAPSGTGQGVLRSFLITLGPC